MVKKKSLKIEANTKGKKASKTSSISSGDVKALTPKVTTLSKKITPYEVFLLCVGRAKNLIKVHEICHGKQSKPEGFLSDAHRAAIILAISALDAFVRVFAISKIRNLLADRKKDLPKDLSDKIIHFLKQDGLFKAARQDDLLERVDKAFTADLEKQSFQGTKNINSLMEMLGYHDIFHQVAKKSKTNEDNLKDDLDKYTLRRHIIAHRGDYDLDQNPPKENTITKKDVTKCIKVVTIIAKHINTLEE